MTETPDEKTLQGKDFDFHQPASRDQAIDQAIDYRGDITLKLTDGQEIEGYVFDRRPIDGRPHLRLMLSSTGEKQVVAYDDIQSLSFTGRDTAAGKSWETWLRKYVEKKKAGESANIYAEKLD